MTVLALLIKQLIDTMTIADLKALLANCFAIGGEDNINRRTKKQLVQHLQIQIQQLQNGYENQHLVDSVIEVGRYKEITRQLITRQPSSIAVIQTPVATRLRNRFEVFLADRGSTVSSSSHSSKSRCRYLRRRRNVIRRSNNSRYFLRENILTPPERFFYGADFDEVGSSTNSTTISSNVDRSSGDVYQPSVYVAPTEDDE